MAPKPAQAMLVATEVRAASWEGAKAAAEAMRAAKIADFIVLIFFTTYLTLGKKQIRANFLIKSIKSGFNRFELKKTKNTKQHKRIKDIDIEDPDLEDVFLKIARG